MRGVSSLMRVTQEGPDGLSRYCPGRVICLEIQLCFLTGALLWQVKLRKPLLWGKRLARTVLIFTERSDQLSRATDRVPGLPTSPAYDL